MPVERLPDLHPPAFGDIEDARRPILSFAWHKQGAHRAAAHSHPRAHIIHPVEGACWAVTPEGTWLVPAGQAIWIPSGVHHEVYTQDTVRAQMLFVDRTCAGTMPPRCGTVGVSPLLAELIHRAVGYGNDYRLDSAAARLAQVLLDELATMTIAPLLVPLGHDPRLLRVMRRLIQDPGSPLELDDLADGSGASTRTLARLFKSETGMTFLQWRTRLRLVESVARLARGESVTAVALDLGYASTSSFVYMFRSNLGVSPGRFHQQQERARL